MKIKNIMIIILLSSMLVFAGCGEDIDCSTQDTTYEKFSLDQETEECVISETIKKDICGNGVAEDDETFCNCAKDVSKGHPTLGCSGSEGTYLEKSCDVPSKSCVLSQNEKVITQTKSLELKNSDLVFDVRVNFFKPFIINTFDDNKIEFDISLFKFPSTSSNMKEIVVNEIKIEDSKGNLLGNAVYGESIVNIGERLKIKKIGLSDTTKYETIDTIKIRLDVSYNKEYIDTKGVPTGKVDTKREIFSTSISKFEIINPKFSD